MNHGHLMHRKGCRCDVCRDGKAAEMRRYRQLRTLNGGRVTETGIVGGHLFEPSELARRQMVDLRRVMRPTRVAAVTGLSVKTVREIAAGKRSRVHPRVANAVHGAWLDHCAATVEHRVPVGPLRRLIEREWPARECMKGEVAPPPISKTDRTYLRRNDTLDTARADRICVALGFLPEEVWGGEWFEEAA